MTTAEQVTRAVEAAVEGTTITRLLRRNAEEFPHEPALTSGIDPGATTFTWSRLRREVAGLTTALAALGLRRNDRMLIAMSKRPEHWTIDLAATHLGALPCTMYDTLSTEQIRYIARHSAATVVVLEGAEQLERWQRILDEMPQLRAVILIDQAITPGGDPRFVGYADLRGQHAPEDFSSAFEELTDAATPDRPLTVVYTSGTTGDPKGVVLSHRNVIHESLMQDALVPVPAHPRSISYLPMAHIAERVLGIYMPICNAGHVTICADQQQLLPTLAAVRPHGFFGVPRVWEKMAAGLRHKLAALSDEDAAHVERARGTALEVFRLRAAGSPVPPELAEQHERLDDAVLRPIRAAIGLDQCTRSFSGAAPIPDEIVEFLAGVGIPVHEVWGLSETTGAATVSTPEVFALGAVGRPAPGVEVRTAEDGELLVRGPVVFSGYLREDGDIASATDDGWFPSGDIGTIDERGIVHVTDRKKELIITAGGKNIPPTRIEGLLRAHPLIGQAAAIGDDRRYITALLVLDEEAAPAWAQARGIAATGIAELARDPQVLAELDEAVQRANGSLARVEQIKRYHVPAAPWTAESGELTPKLSLRRKVIADRYADEIDAMYD